MLRQQGSILLCMHLEPNTGGYTHMPALFQSNSILALRRKMKDRDK